MDLASEKKTVFIALTKKGAGLAARLAEELGGVCHATRDALGDGAKSNPHDVIEIEGDFTKHIRDVFLAGNPVIGICAAGIMIRAIAAHLGSKHHDAPVLAMSEDGKIIAPLLGGHHGGNALADAIAEITGGVAAITTAGDRAFGIMLDAPPRGFAVAEDMKKKMAPLMAALLAGQKANLRDDLPPALSHIAVAWREWLKPVASEDGAITLHLTLKPAAMIAPDADCVFHPQCVAMGLGASRNCPTDEMAVLVEDGLTRAGIAREAVQGIYSIDLKADEAAIIAVADKMQKPMRVFTPARLDAETPRLASAPSREVKRATGSHSVAEASALAAAGEGGILLLPKITSANATMALALRVGDGDGDDDGAMRKCGRLMLVGIGPGKSGWRTPEATAMIASADELVGYGFYINLIGSIARHKKRRDFALGEEEARCRYALTEAAKGRDIALICSGDAGIYAMGALVYELMARDANPPRVQILTAPGVSAMQAAAAKSGAILGHDFCAISLSDLLTPRAQIEKRILAAATGDFVIAFYNPVSSRRRAIMQKAKEILLAHRAPQTPVVLACNLGRENETIRHRDLGALDIDEIDMMTVVLVGSSASKRIKHGGRESVFTPRGYDAKIKKAGGGG